MCTDDLSQILSYISWRIGDKRKTLWEDASLECSNIPPLKRLRNDCLFLEWSLRRGLTIPIWSFSNIIVLLFVLDILCVFMAFVQLSFIYGIIIDVYLIGTSLTLIALTMWTQTTLWSMWYCFFGHFWQIPLISGWRWEKVIRWLRDFWCTMSVAMFCFFFNEPSTAVLFLFLLHVWIMDSFLKQENNMENFSELTDPLTLFIVVVQFLQIRLFSK